MPARFAASSTLVAGLAALLLVPVADARVQGVKGRRLQVFAPLRPYATGVVFVEEPSVVASDATAVVKTQGIKWLAHEFLETRLRELPWTVRPWYDDFGPIERHEALGPALLLSSVLYFEAAPERRDLLSLVPLIDIRPSMRHLALEVFLRDQATGEVIARYTGFGRGVVRRTWPGARDDLQEITRVLVDYLAAEFGVRPPTHHGGYGSDPYRRRSRSAVVYPEVTEAEPPRMFLHGEPPVQLDAPAPVAIRYRAVGDEVHRQHFEPPPSGAEADESTVSPPAEGPAATAGTSGTSGASAHANAHRREPAERAPAAEANGPNEPTAPAGTPPAGVTAPRPRSEPVPLAADGTVYTVQGSGIYHVDPRCRPLRTRPPRKLSEAMARQEELLPCPVCAGGSTGAQP